MSLLYHSMAYARPLCGLLKKTSIFLGSTQNFGTLLFGKTLYKDLASALKVKILVRHFI